MLLWVVLLACGPESKEGDGAKQTSKPTNPLTTDTNSDTTPTQSDEDAPAPTTRRLSNIELANTLEQVLGVTPEALSLLPPDGHGYTYDRVVAGQTMSRAHLDAFYAIAEESADALFANDQLSVLSAACNGVELPPSVTSAISRMSGAEIGLGPEWSVGVAPNDPSIGTTTYSPDPLASAALTFPADGVFDVTLELDTSGLVDQLEVRFDGNLVDTVAVNGRSEVTVQVDASAGPGVIEYHLITNPEDHNLAVAYIAVTIEGPFDLTDPSGRRECGEGLVADLGPRLFRRPITPEESTRLMGLYDGTEGATAFELLLTGLIANPNTLYLVETGTETAPGVFELNPWEQAARLSYALCEQPPDAELRDAAANNSLSGPDALEEHARRLLTSPCGEVVVDRFVGQWLHLRELDGLNKSPEVFVGFDDDTLEGLKAESARYTYEMVYGRATLADFFTSAVAWPDPRSSWLMGLNVASQEETSLPPERRGVLAQPSLLAVTANFEETSPVKRGVFVLDQLLCDELPPPPPELMVAPPPPDEGLTTRERWAQHSNDPVCASCHVIIDPIGFSFEAFDGVGQYRTTENGRPIDTTGGLPSIGVVDGELDGLVELSEALSVSERLPQCFAKQWLRATLGRLDDPRDADSLATLADAAASEPLLEALVTWVRTPAFTQRYEESP